MNRGFLELPMTNSIQGAERGYQIIETMIEQKTGLKNGDKTILLLELPLEISETLLQKGFLTSDESTNRIEITPKGIKLISIIESLHDIIQK